MLSLSEEFELTTREQELLTTTAVLGQIAGALGGGILANAIGRKKSVVLIVAGYAVFALLGATSVSVPMLVVARLLLGVTIGLSVVVVPVYVAESAPAAVRGSLVTAYQLATLSGIVVGYLVGYLLAGSHGWRAMFGLAAAPATLLLPLLWRMPDTARWYLLKGRIADARSALRRIQPEADIDAELADMAAAVDERGGGIGEMVRRPYLRATLFVIALGFLVQITGINAIIYYSPRLFAAMGFAGYFAMLALPAMVQVAGLAAVCASLFLVDRLGRRPILLSGIATMITADAVLITVFANDSDGGTGLVLGFAGVLLFIIGFNFGFGSLVWVYAAESFPSRLRSMGSSLMLTSTLTANAIVAAFSLTMLRVLGGLRHVRRRRVRGRVPLCAGDQGPQTRGDPALLGERRPLARRAVTGGGRTVTVLGADAVVIDGRICRPGWVHTADGRILSGGAGAPPMPADAEFPDAIVVPGFVDMHVHGGGGASFADGNAADIARAAEFHLRHGTTTTLASLVTAGPAELLSAVGALAEATRDGVVAGIHLEGPWLSPARCGAHDHTRMRAPDPAEIESVLAAADGAVRMVTLAPELPGSDAAIRRFRDAEVVVAVGHTDATYTQTRHAIDLGATVGTHLFNAMPPLDHRAPGPVLALLCDPRVTVEIIADGVHVHPAVVHAVIEAVGPDRVAVVTDAIAAAGCGDGAFRLGTMPIEVESSVARVAGASTLAGSTTTMDQLFRTVAGLGSKSDSAGDVALAAAVQVTSATPARALGLTGVGRLAAGYAANLVVLDRDLRVTAVMVNDDWRVG